MGHLKLKNTGLALSIFFGIFLAVSFVLAVVRVDSLATDTSVQFTQIATPANPPSSNYKVYVKSDGRLYILNSTGTETWTSAGGSSGSSFADNLFTITDDADPTKGVMFEASAVGTGTTAVITLPGTSSTLIGTSSTDTLTNKSMSGASNTFTNIPNSATTAVATNTVSTIVARDSSGNFAAGTITAALTGNASTASALAADPADCASDTYATSIAAAGTLTCATVTNAGLAGSIALSKLAATTASRAIVSDGSGVLIPATTTATEIGYVNGVTSAIQTQLNAKAPAASPTFTGTVTTPVTASRALVTGASSELAAATTTATEIGYVNGVTSAIQTQLDAKVAKSTYSAKGSILAATAASTPADLPIGTDGYVLTADAASSPGLKWAAATAAPSTSYELSNVGLSVGIGSSAISIALKQADGSTDCSTGASACKIGFRDSTVTTGGYVQRSVTAALSMSVTSGATLGHANNIGQYVNVYALDNAGTVELAVVGLAELDTGTVQTSTTMANTADSSSTLYSTTGRASKAIRLIGRFKILATTAGTWTTAPSEVSVVPFQAAPRQVGFYVNGDQTGTLSNAAFATTVFATTVKDTHSGYSAGIYTIPAGYGGWWSLAGAVAVTASHASGNRTIIAFVDNAATQYGRSGQVGQASLSAVFNMPLAANVYLNAGQTIKIGTYTEATTPTYANTENAFFSGVWLGP